MPCQRHFIHDAILMLRYRPTEWKSHTDFTHSQPNTSVWITVQLRRFLSQLLLKFFLLFSNKSGAFFS